MHNDLATALDAGGEYGQAEFHARSSLEIMLQAQAEGSSVDTEHVTRVYYNLGNILIHNGIEFSLFLCYILLPYIGF